MMTLNEALDHEVKRLLIPETELPPAYQAEVARRAREAQEDEPMTSESAPDMAALLAEAAEAWVAYELRPSQENDVAASAAWNALCVWVRSSDGSRVAYLFEKACVIARAKAEASDER